MVANEILLFAKFPILICSNTTKWVTRSLLRIIPSASSSTVLLSIITVVANYLVGIWFYLIIIMGFAIATVIVIFIVDGVFLIMNIFFELDMRM